MAKIRIANAQFEWEMQQKKPADLISSFLTHPIYLQLQFLSLLYSEPDDLCLITHTPDPDFIKRIEKTLCKKITFDFLQTITLPKYEIDTWGDSLSISSWAKKRNLPFAPPSWDVVKEVNSKAFSFNFSPKLDDSMLIQCEDELQKWMGRFSGAKVLKSCYGLSGRGNMIVQNTLGQRERDFVKKELLSGNPIIAEPWVDRILDFSTQWLISKDGKISYLGSTICKNNSRGSYERTIVLPNDSIGAEYEEYLSDHKKAALEVLTLMVAKGFYGHVGIDAMIYKKKNKLTLHPIVEINARKTMGWNALVLQRNHFPDKMLSLSFSDDDKEKSLLPYSAQSQHGQIINFPKSLSLCIS